MRKKNYKPIQNKKMLQLRYVFLVGNQIHIDCYNIIETV
jgi:hypothetical protein